MGLLFPLPSIYTQQRAASRNHPKKEERHMERKLHTHKYTPTHPSKRNCLASSSFQSMNTPPPPAKRARQKNKSKLKRQKFFFSLRENFQ